MKRTVHLMGIGGTGMVALAEMFQRFGWEVRGSDENVYPPASEELQRMKIVYAEGFRAENLDPKPDLVIVGNVISRSNPEAEALLASNIAYTSMAQGLAEYFLQNRTPIVVSGTHGKSTTTSLMAWILEVCGQDPGFFIGAVPNNFRVGARIGRGLPFVIEGDEYDTAFFEKTPKFLHYRAHHAIVTSVEFDHADIYNSIEEIEVQFQKLISALPKDGFLIACADEPRIQKIIRQSRTSARAFTYGFDVNAFTKIVKVSVAPTGSRIEIKIDGRIYSLNTLLLGNHNASNIAACFTLGLLMGLDTIKMTDAISTFSGVRRRQEFIGEGKDVRIYDDFAHHPTAIRETLSAFKSLAENRKGRLWAVLEPRSNTLRRRVFVKELPQSFALADGVILAPVYQKKDALTQTEKLRPEEVAEEIRKTKKLVFAPQTYNEIEETLVKMVGVGDVVVFMSNGSFGDLPRKFFNRLKA